MNLKEQVALVLYTVLMIALQPVFALHLLWRSRKQTDYLKHWSHRFLARAPLGHKGLKQTRRIWVHAVSVGETHAVSPLVKAWQARFPDDVWIISSTTPTGRDAAMQAFGHLNGVQFFYLPYDLPWLIRRCIRRVNADQLWLVETELWPHLIAQSHSVNLPVSLINARVSPKTGARLKKLAWLSRPALAKLNTVACQTEADARVFESLGRPADRVTGNLKFDVALRPDLMTKGQAWKQALGAESVLVFASSREGEEAKLLDAMVRQQFFKRLPKVSVWIVPRHPQRCEEVFEQMKTAAARLSVAFPKRRSQWTDDDSLSFCPLVLGDSMGEMPAYYSLATVALLGGSWGPWGGQNLIEACAHECPVWMGPNTWNFQKAAEDALAATAAVRFEDLAQAIHFFLEMHGAISPESRQAAKRFARAHAGATEKTLSLLI